MTLARGSPLGGHSGQLGFGVVSQTPVPPPLAAVAGE